MLSRGFLFLLLSACIGAPTALHAQQLEAQYHAWQVFTATEKGKRMCYLASSPAKQEGNYTKRSEPYLLVNHLSKDKDEVSVTSGYRYKKNHDVVITIKNKSYKLFTQGELAWAYNGADDRALVQAMIKEATLTVRGTSWKDSRSTDTYSLKGFAKAYQKMKGLCK